jgi:hypothetical protein
MPRWAVDYKPRLKQTCRCGGKKDFYAIACRKCTVPGKPLLGISGKDHPAWKRGFRIDDDGYIKTYAPSHPWPRRGGYVLEHVRLMELAIGRRIRGNEVVHHVNENRQDNRTDRGRTIGETCTEGVPLRPRSFFGRRERCEQV